MTAGGPEFDDSAEDLYENAPCGYLSTLPDGRITRINARLLGWLGYRREDVVGRLRFADLLTVGGKLYHETHFAPLLRMQGELGGVALELVAADGSRLPVLATSAVKAGPDGEPRQIRTTLFEARDRRAYERELLRARRDADRERDRVQQLVTTLQRSLLPPNLTAPPGLEVAAYYHPASADQIGGDFYDLFPLAAGRWGFFLGDVCGKGAEAASVTSLTRYTLRAAAVHDSAPEAVLKTLDTVLQQEYGQFCTVLYGVLVPGENGCDITLASGGHPPLVLRADGSLEPLHTPGGQLVGILPNTVFATTSAHLGPGDALLLYTDGLFEARTTGRERYGEEALHAFTKALAPTTAPALVDAITGLLRSFGAGLDDDVAVLAMSVR